MGLYGRHRQHFACDITYNKYHFGVYLQLFSALGLFSVRKMPYRPQIAAYALFVLSMALNSFPSYKEGIREIKNEENVPSSGLMRKIGFYCLVGGYGLIVLASRGKIS